MSDTETYSLSEAAFVLGQPVSEVRRTIERKGIRCQLIIRGGRRMRVLDHKTLVFLNWARDHQDEIKPALWQKLYANLTEHSVLPTHIDAGVFRVSLREAAQQVLRRLGALRDQANQIEFTEDGDAVLKGTDVEVHRIAGLLQGDMSRDEVLGDYPSLSADQVDLAVSYAAAHPKPGRPYPPLSAKAALRKADLSALDAD